MRILIVSTMANNFGKRGMYQSQEIGLARGFSSLGHRVTIYKSVRTARESGSERIDTDIDVNYIKCIHIGSNGFLPHKYLDRHAKILVQFSDTQLSVPGIYRWCVRNNVSYIPYIGITWSQGINGFIRYIMNFLSERNMHVYRKVTCAVKTEQAKKELLEKGVTSLRTAPVCIDFGQLNTDYDNIAKEPLKKKWGIEAEKVFLFIGRLDQDKHPLDMIDIFKNVKDKSSNLIMVGTGKLSGKVKDLIRDQRLETRVHLIEKVPHPEMWEIYRISDVLVNLNPSEIWGMALLEAMYYKVEIVAVSAPGPQAMLIDGVTGHLAGGNEEVLKKLNDLTVNSGITENACHYVRTVFNWEKTAKIFLDIKAQIPGS